MFYFFENILNFIVDIYLLVNFFIILVKLFSNYNRFRSTGMNFLTIVLLITFSLIIRFLFKKSLIHKLWRYSSLKVLAVCFAIQNYIPLVLGVNVASTWCPINNWWLIHVVILEIYDIIITKILNGFLCVKKKFFYQFIDKNWNLSLFINLFEDHPNYLIQILSLKFQRNILYMF